MEIEVKIKSSPGLERRIRRVTKLAEKQTHYDTYYSSPSRDFSVTDEALRVRKEGRRITLTYKGPKLDSETKSREEVIVQTDENIHPLLLELGFRKVLEVRKKREFRRRGKMLVSIDDVEGLGRYIECELQGNDLKAGKRRIFSFLDSLGVSPKESITKSYLELLLEG